MLVTRCSDSVNFFKLETLDKDDPHKYWINYHIVNDLRGNIFYQRGNVRIQITTDSKIFFYLIDKITFEPSLENVMNNFMKCSQMMFGAKVRNCVTFK